MKMQPFYKTLADFPKEEYFTSGHRLCAGCPHGILSRFVTKVAGKDCIIISPTGCLEVATSIFPETAWRVPWTHVAFENAAAVASGVESAIKALKNKGTINKNREISIIVLAGDGATADIGIQALSGMMDREHKVLYICQDNEAYMNTGIQRSGSTPLGAWATTSPVGKILKGKTQPKKDMIGIAVAHNIPYVASGIISHWVDLLNKIKKGINTEGPAYINVLSPCPTGWRFDPSLTVEIGKLAVQTGMWILYEVQDGKMTVTTKVPKRKKVEEYLKMQGRFRHLTGEDIRKIQEQVNKYVAEVNKLVGTEAIGPVR
jgi:pyruvate ferredoxin oxidoreductase beta subunit